MKYNYYIADVFTKQIFNGAQIAVFPVAEGLNTQQMQLVARELNLTETVFVFQPNKENSMRVMRISHRNMKSILQDIQLLRRRLCWRVAAKSR